MKVYVSGPMTGIEDFNFPAFNAAAARLEVAGHDAENPADTGIVDGWSWADYLRHDVRLITYCDGIATLPGHEHSKGATLELHIARELGLDIRPLEEWL